MGAKKLNLGCGTDTREGWVNLDCAALPGVDIVHDLEELPLPFADEEFHEVLCLDILEHLELVPVVRELHRILKPGGRLSIRVPHFTSMNNFIDPTHKTMFSIRTFEFFVKGSRFRRNYYFDFSFSEISHSRITFEKEAFRGLLAYNYLVEFIVNLVPKMRSFYEATFLSGMFPAHSIVIEMVK